MRRLFIYSRDRESHSTSSSDMTISLRQPISEGRYKVLQTCFYNGIYNINSYNNKIYWTTTSDGSLTSTLTPGYYTSTTLTSHLSTVLSADGTPTITTSYSDETGKFNFSASAGNISFTFSTNTSNSARYLLGFDEENTSESSSITSTNPADISYTRYIGIDIDEFSSNYNDVNNRARTYLYPINSSFSNVQYTNLQESYENILTLPNPTRKLNIKLYDDSGRPLSNNNLDWSFILEKL